MACELGAASLDDARCGDAHGWSDADSGGLDAEPGGAHRGEAREWLSLEDPLEHRTWLFDVTFLTSRWTCIYGVGCPGIDVEPAPELALGCCSHGAFLAGDDDLAHVRAMVAELDAETWQLHRDPAEALWRDEDGWWRTRVVDGACVFANRAGHRAGTGCAFHLLAQRTGRRPLDTKPEICWQAPLRREDHETVTGHVYTMVREWELRDWGGPDTDVAWWCTSAPAAHVGTRTVFESLRDELTAICGTQIYAELRAELTERVASARLLPHPTVRRR